MRTLVVALVYCMCNLSTLNMRQHKIEMCIFLPALQRRKLAKILSSLLRSETWPKYNICGYLLKANKELALIFYFCCYSLRNGICLVKEAHCVSVIPRNYIPNASLSIIPKCRMFLIAQSRVVSF